jgi:hypothetical protein
VGGGSRSASIRSGLVLIRAPRRIGSDRARVLPRRQQKRKSRRRATSGAPGVGFEPTTLRLTAERSAIELPRTGTREVVGRKRRDSAFDFRVAVGAQ